MIPVSISHSGAQKHVCSHLWSLLLIIALSCCATAPKDPVVGSPDEALTAAVAEALAADDRLDSAAIVIMVAEGIVDLSGTVGSADQVRRALRRAADVKGVRGIVNRLRVIER